MSGHDEVVTRQIEIVFPDQFNVLHVLLGQRRHGNVHDVELLLLDQPEQQIERSLEGFQKHLQSVGRDIESGRHFIQRLAVKEGNRVALGEGQCVVQCLFHKEKTRPDAAKASGRAWSVKTDRRCLIRNQACTCCR